MFERVWWKPWTWFPVGSIETREPEFRPVDKAMLLAHLELEARPRNSLGVLLEEATDPANQFAYTARDKPLTDWAAATVGAKQDAFYKNRKDAARHGHIWTLKP